MAISKHESARGESASATARIDLSIVVPVYRNADTLKELHRRLCDTLEAQGIDFEIIFVDDACPDDSLSVLKSLAPIDPRVAVLILKRNIGQHRADLVGLAYARGAWTVVMDADLQDPPEAIPQLLATGEEGFDAVFAGRRGRYESPSRLFSSYVFKRLLHVISGVPVDAGLFVAMNRSMRESLLAMGGPAPFIVAMIGCTNLPVASVPVERAQRLSGSSAYNSWRRLKSGGRAVGWVAVWKWRKLTGREYSSGGSASPNAPADRFSMQVAERIGARFTSCFSESGMS